MDTDNNQALSTKLDQYLRWMTNRKLIEFSMTGFDFNGGLNVAVNGSLPNDFYYNLGYFGGMDNTLWTTAALLKYYIDPQYINSPVNLHSVSDKALGVKDPMNFNNGILTRRVDNNAGVIANGACNSLMGVLFPEGFDSFSIRFDKVRKHIDANDQTTPFILKKIEQDSTDELRKILVSTKYSLHSKISSMLFDYINYGTAIAIWQNNKLSHVPFMQSAIASNGDNDEQMICWTRPISLLDLENDDKKDLLPHYETYIYLPSKMVNKTGSSYYCAKSNVVTSYNSPFTIKSLYEIGRLPISNDIGTTNPIMIARMNHDSSKIYGIGCGLKALAEIYLMNYYSNLLKLTTMCSIYVPIVVPDNLSVEMVNNPVYNSVSGNSAAEPIAALPGARIAVAVNTEVAQAGQKFEVIKPDDSRIAEQLTICQQNVEKAYFMELIAMLRGQALTADRRQNSPMTATQAQLISNLTVTELRGLIGNFYDQIVNPIVHIYASMAMTNIVKVFGEELEVLRKAVEGKVSFNPATDFNLNYYSYSRSVKAKERSEMSMNYAAMLRNLGVELAPDSSEMELMKRNYLEAMD